MTNKNNPKRLRREDSFLGVHFDMHATKECTQIGKNVTPKMVADIIKKIRPDFIHCDCKGHPGITSYPTKLGNAAPGFVRDPLRIWRDVTAKYGVALYMHYCGIWSSEGLERHPSWARVKEDGKKDKLLNSVFGPYVDKLLIPQFKELIDKYDVDGAWIDGDCWAAAHDYSKKTLQEFKDQTDIKSIPRSPKDPYFYAFTEFCRQRYRRYMDRYVTELHKYKPDFQVCSNWAYSSFMPEAVKTDVDFLSGDYPSLNSVNMARFEARCLVHQGKPWDLLAWGFAFVPKEGLVSTKSAVQMQQEAAITLALGGAMAFYFYQPKRDASINMWELGPMAEVAKFCRQRQAVCHRAKPIPQIAILHSASSYYRQSPRLFCPRDPFVMMSTDILTPARGILQCLLESQHVVDVMMDHQLAANIDKYSLVVVPELEYLGNKVKKQLLAYTKSGGNLLVIGPLAAKLFKKELGVTLSGKPQQKAVWLECDNALGCINVHQKIKLKKGTRPFGRFFEINDTTGPSQPAASIVRYGKGKIAGVYLNIGESYTKAATATLRKFVAGLVREVFPTPTVIVSGSQYVDVTLNQLEGKVMINLVNTAGPHADDNIHVFDEIPAVGPLEITLCSSRKPKKVILEPEHKLLKYTFAGGKIKLKLSRLAIHSIIVIE